MLTMQISLEKRLLLKALFHQQGLIERRVTSPVLSHVLLEALADSASLRLTGTDLEISLIEDIDATIENSGSISVGAHMLYEIVRKMPDGVIYLSTDAQKRLRVHAQSVEFTLPTLPAKDFPPVHPSTPPTRFSMPAATLRNLIESTRFSMSFEEARHSLNGIYFHFHESQWRAVATDAQRLALTWVTDLDGVDSLPKVIVGRKAIGEISKLLDEYQGSVEIALSESQLILFLARCTFASRLINGQFPDYWQAIPSGHPHVVDIDVKKLEEAIARVSMVSFDKQKVIKFLFSPQHLVFSAYSPQHGSALETMEVDYDGQECALGFNPKHVLDICTHIKGSSLRVSFKNNTSPVLIQDVTCPETSYVLMPTRFQDYGQGHHQVSSETMAP